MTPLNTTHVIVVLVVLDLLIDDMGDHDLPPGKGLLPSCADSFFVVDLLCNKVKVSIFYRI